MLCQHKGLMTIREDDDDCNGDYDETSKIYIFSLPVTDNLKKIKQIIIS